MKNWKFQRLILIISATLLIGKFIAYFITNSAGIYSDAMESIVNVVAGTISLIALYWASKPADKKHPFGHGKMELISASIEGILIMVAGGLIIFEGINRLFNHPTSLPKLEIGIIITAFTGIVNYILGLWSIKKGKKTKSMALVAGGKHLQSDTYSTLGLVMGLILIQFTKIIIIDSIIALIFGSIVAITGIKILRKTFSNLVDEADKEELNLISKKLEEYRKEDWIGIHSLKVIRYGSSLHIDCDLILPFYYSIKEGHKCTEDLKNTLLSSNEDLFISIHSDSCDEKYCFQCLMSSCTYRKEKCIKPFNFSIDNLIERENN